MTPPLNQSQVFSVTEVNSIARDLLENALMPMWVNAEIGTLMVARSGHVYLTLKDKSSQVRAVWFGGWKMIEKLGVKIGDAVEVFGQLSVYVAGGDFQFKIQSMRPVGLGDLQRRFEQIKQTLDQEGLFASERKRPLPPIPRRIGVITSADGAALHDFVNVITRRFPAVHILIYPAQVQGRNAHETLVRGLFFFNALPEGQRPDVVVLTRGGGSMEDLWCFNEESLARAIADSQIPVVSAVGHEIDFTIADFVADLRAPTPSAAAELLVPEYTGIVDEIDEGVRRLKINAQLCLQNARTQFQTQQAQLEKFRPEACLKDYQQKLDQMDMQMVNLFQRSLQESSFQLERETQNLNRAVQTQMKEKQHTFYLLVQQLKGINPQAVLARGYAMIKNADTQQIITSSKNLNPKDVVVAQFHDGEVRLQVQSSERSS